MDDSTLVTKNAHNTPAPLTIFFLNLAQFPSKNRGFRGLKSHGNIDPSLNVALAGSTEATSLYNPGFFLAFTTDNR